MNTEKTSQLVWDMRIVRTLLKRNPTEPAKYCRYCGKLLSEGCECKQPVEIIDVKKSRDVANGTIAIFANTPWFQESFAEITEEFKVKDSVKQSAQSDSASEQLARED